MYGEPDAAAREVLAAFKATILAPAMGSRARDRVRSLVTLAPTPTVGNLIDLMDSTGEWRQIARQDDVLHSILSWPGMENKWTEEAFYETGRSDWSDFRNHWVHYNPDLGGRCLEVGCGAGRLTAALATEFEQVVALDVSPEMIERARAASPENVDFELVDGPAVPLPDGAVDAVFSVHVLQHLDNYEALRDYVIEIRRVLRGSGTVMLHIWTSSDVQTRRSRLLQDFRVWVSRRQLGRHRRPSAVRMRIYQPELVHALLAEAGFTQIESRTFAVRSNGFHHDFWLARAEAGSPPQA